MSLYNTERFGENPQIWIGQIVDDEYWKDNEKRDKWEDVDDIPGWGTRYKVRIFGSHPENTNVLSNDKLPWVEVMYPVTSGSGHASSWQSSNLRKGSYVIGIYKDQDRNEPIIIGCLGNNEQTLLKNKSVEKGFVPISGLTNENSPVFSMPSNGNNGQAGTSKALESNTASSVSHTSLSDKIMYDGGKSRTYLRLPSTCEKIQPGEIQLKIQNLIKDLEKVKKQAQSWENAIRYPISENGQQFSIEEYVQYKIQNVAKDISKGVKWVIEEVQKYVTRKVNAGAKDLYYIIFPDQRQLVKESINTVNDLIACLFRKIIGNLIRMVAKFLLSIVNRYINTPLCAVENFIGSLLGQITGLITSALSAILAPVNAVLGIIDIVGDVIGFIEDLLSYLSCDEEPSCSEITEWSIWDGPGTNSENLNFDFTGIISKSNQVASTIRDTVDAENFDFDLDFSDILEDTCNIGPVFCGPPIIEFYSGGGSGAVGNVIISATGSILGVDVLASGSGYSNAPIVNFRDKCGNGVGAVGTAILGNISDPGEPEDYGVIGVIMDQSGFGYLQTSDGSQGGDGRTWANVEDTTVKRSDGTYDIPYPPGNTIELMEGDTVRIPFGSNLEIGNTIINGGVDYKVKSTSTITSPKPIKTKNDYGNYPTKDTGEYPVILYLCEIRIKNSGVNYSPEDKIIIEPNNNTIAQPIFGPFGVLQKVKILSYGSGFTERPRIYIESETGYNAELIPVFCIDRVGKDEIKEPSIQDKLISVVDCVGKI
jgi:hypothetical protein